MTVRFTDRRRTARVIVPRGVRWERPVVMSVRLLEIGQGGVLMLSSEALEIGQRARLCARVGTHRLDTEIEIRRATVLGGDRAGYHLGGRFVALDTATRTMLRELMSESDQ